MKIEFGSFSYGDRFVNGLIAAALSEVALDEQVFMSPRHILIEEQPGGFFAAAAAPLSPAAATPVFWPWEPSTRSGIVPLCCW